MPIYYSPPPPAPDIMIDVWGENVWETPPPATKPLDRVHCSRLFRRIEGAPTEIPHRYFDYKSRKSPCGVFVSFLLDFEYLNPHREVKEVWVFAQDLVLNASKSND